MNEQERLKHCAISKNKKYFENKDRQQYQKILKKKIITSTTYNHQIHMGTVLRILREEFGLSQDELGAYLNLKRQTISSWENNNTFPEIKTVIELANFFQISLDLLFFRKDYL